MTGCYICQPERHPEGDEACSACDAEFWASPVAVIVNPQENGDS